MNRNNSRHIHLFPVSLSQHNVAIEYPQHYGELTKIIQQLSNTDFICSAVTLGKISFLEFSEAMERGKEAQEGVATGDGDVYTLSTGEQTDTQMEVEDTAKDEPAKPSSKSVIQ